jgi:predicted glutamine amidotransferase
MDHNKDGLGIMYIDPKTSKVTVERYLPKDVWAGSEIIEKRFDALKNIHAVFHLRFRTHGDISLPNTHPFKVLDKKKHGKDLYFMHNGMINLTSTNPADKGKSDTILFNETILQPTLQKYPELLYNEAFQSLICEYIGHSKLLFMDSDGVITRLGEWETNEQCIVSNNSYFTRYSPPVSNHAHRYNQYEELYWEKEYKKYDSKPKDSTLPVVFTPKQDNNVVPLIGFMPQSVESDALARTTFLKAKANKVDENKNTYDPYAADSDESFMDMVMIKETLKHIDEVQLADLSSLMETNDIYDLVCEYPEKMSDLMQELVEYNVSLENMKLYGY